jgi:NAD(P)H-flavin reductase/ferredoxin
MGTDDAWSYRGSRRSSAVIRQSSCKEVIARMAYKVRIATVDRIIDVADRETILEAALAADINYPFACHSGTCGTCKSLLLSGEVELLEHSSLALTAEERSQGFILACSAVPSTDCEVSFTEEPEAESHPLRKLECRVADLTDATHDIKLVALEAEGEAPLVFAAGQFVRLAFGDLPGRDYSMANRPDVPRLEFHIRLTSGGAASGYVHHNLKPGDRVTVRGPYGTSFLRKAHPGPILALAGGSGLAPIKSILDTALGEGLTQKITLYFGVRDERDLYLEEHFHALVAAHENFSFVPVLSQPAQPTARRTGFLADVVTQDFSTLSGWKVYLAGPPIMVETCTAAVLRLGLGSTDCHADAFYTKSDRPTSSDT